MSASNEIAIWYTGSTLLLITNQLETDSEQEATLQPVSIVCAALLMSLGLTCWAYDSLSPPTGITMTCAGDSHRGLREGGREVGRERGEEGKRRETGPWVTIIQLSSGGPADKSFNYCRIFSPFPSKVLRQDGDHPLQGAQHGPVHHHGPVALTV